MAGAEEEEELTPIPSAATFPGYQDGGGPYPMLVSMEPVHFTWGMVVPTMDTTGSGDPMAIPGDRTTN